MKNGKKINSTGAKLIFDIFFDVREVFKSPFLRSIAQAKGLVYSSDKIIISHKFVCA